MTAEECVKVHVANLWQWKKYVEENLYNKEIWHELWQKSGKIDSVSIQKFYEESLTEITNRERLFPSLAPWEIAGEMGLPQLGRYYPYTLKSANISDSISSKLSVHFENREEFCYCWTGDYTYAVKSKWIDGDYQAFFSEEYIGCGNGHYYYLLSPSNAIYAESD